MHMAMTVSAQARLILLLWIVLTKTPAVSRFSVCGRLLSHTAFGITDAGLHSSAATCHHLWWASLLSFKINQVPSAFRSLLHVVFCRPWTNTFSKAGASRKHCENHSSGAQGLGLWPTVLWKCLLQSNTSVAIDAPGGRMTEGFISGLVCHWYRGLLWTEVSYTFLVLLTVLFNILTDCGRVDVFSWQEIWQSFFIYQGMPEMVPVLPGGLAPGMVGCSLGERWTVLLKWHLCLK